jgi:hypothetical protein
MDARMTSAVGERDMSSEKIIIEIADLVVEYCREPDGRTRAEDAISAAAAVAGEACIPPRDLARDAGGLTSASALPADLFQIVTSRAGIDQAAAHRESEPEMTEFCPLSFCPSHFRLLPIENVFSGRPPVRVDRAGFLS